MAILRGWNAYDSTGKTPIWRICSIVTCTLSPDFPAAAGKDHQTSGTAKIDSTAATRLDCLIDANRPCPVRSQITEDAHVMAVIIGWLPLKSRGLWTV